MSTVYRAHDRRLDRDVAVKVLNAAGLGSEGRAREAADKTGLVQWYTFSDADA
jgi:hypothetical protein